MEVFDVRPPTRVAGREELQVVAQIASSTYDRALRASGMDGVMTRPLYTTEKEKYPVPPRTATSRLHTGGSLAKDVLAGRTSLRSCDETFGARCEGENSGLRGGDEAGAARELHEIPGGTVGRLWTAALVGTRSCNGLPRRLQSESSENLSTGLQTHLGCKSPGAPDERKTATRFRPLQ